MFVKKVFMEKESTVYVLQELPGTRIGRPKFNIMGAQKYGKLKVLLKENKPSNSTEQKYICTDRPTYIGSKHPFTDLSY